MTEAIRKDAKSRMAKSLDALRGELAKLRTGRASPALLAHLRVDYYGTPTPIDQVATVAVADPRTLSLTPWEKKMVPVLEKAILESDLGLNPVTSGEVIRIPLPALTEERRREMTKLVRSEGEQAKVAVRNIRRDAIHRLRDCLKSKELSEDEEKRAQDEVQKLTDDMIAEIDKVVAAKENEVMEV